MKNLFKMENFNIIEDEENYYFFRALNMADNQDLELGKITDENGKYTKIRTDRERYEENTENNTSKYNEASEISLEQVYDHIKMHYRKDTNCISLSSNANVSICYGREFYKDKYIMVKVPKKEFGEKVINAGQYMLEEINKKIDEYISSINADSKIIEALSDIENSKTSDEIKKAIEARYTSKEKIAPNKAKMRKGILYKLPYARISNYQTLNEEQSLEKNKIIGKLTFLERNCGMPPVIPNTANNNLLVQTIGNAFSSLEIIHNGNIEKENIIDVPKEMVDIFALLQQIEGQDKKIVRDLKKEVIKFINEGKNIKIPKDSKLIQNNDARKNITIEEMYELTNGKVEYGMANSIVKNMFYLAKGQSNARELAKILNQITGEKPKYNEIIQYISNNAFEILPQVITRRNNKGVRISESVNLNLKAEEIDLIDKIKQLSEEEQTEIIENGGLSNVRNIMSSTFSKTQKDAQIGKEKYYAEAIFSLYNWNKIGIEEFTSEEKNNLLQRIENEYCVELYKKLEEQGIDINKIPTILLNMVTRKNNFEITEKDTPESIKEKRLEQYDKMIKENIFELNEGLSIERIERFLGYYDIEGTEIQLRPYQQRALEKTEEIFEKERFASVILPTGAGKSFVALSQLMEHKDEEILYLAPQNEILEQMKDYIIKYIHGPVNTLGRSKDDIVKDVFPNLKFCMYPTLLSKEAEEIINKKYKFVVLDELHRTGAKEWGDKLNNLIDNQPNSTKVLGITATPRRDADGKNMANKMAERLGYTNKEATSGKHLAMNMSLINAIRMGLVVNPKLVSCAYNLKTDGSLDRLEEKISSIKDVEQRNEKLEKYEKLKRNLDQAEGIEQILQSNVKQGGKYIVFLPVVDNIEDEDGNKIGRKTGKSKIEDYEKQIAEYFKGSNITPHFHSMLGEYGDKENAKRLEEFQNTNSDATEFMLVMNKANEGLHLDKLDGIIWLRPLDEKSRILYLQQLGRIIYSEDSDNITKDEDRPTVIDLVNNTLKVNWDNEITKKDDIELLTIITDWVEKHDGTLPNINSTNKEEKGYATILKEIQTKYKEYLENEFDDLNEKQIQEVQEIIRLGAKIDLWQIELPEKILKNGGTKGKKSENKKDVGIFEITGILNDFIELEDEVNNIVVKRQVLKNALEIQKWCKEKYGDKKIWERKMPNKKSKDKYEKNLGIKLITIRKKLKQYQEMPLERIENEEDRQIVQIIQKLDREYGLGEGVKNILEIEEWCKEKYGDKKIWERKLPSPSAKDEYEKSLGIKLSATRLRRKRYQGIPLDKIENKENRQIVEIIRKLDKEYGLVANLKNAIEIEEWCKGKYGDKKIWERNLPSAASKDEYEKSLGQKLSDIRRKIKQYQGIPLEEIENEEDREIAEIVRRLDKEYGLVGDLKNAIKIEEWCKEKYGDKKIWERNLPIGSSEDEYEKSLGIKLSDIRSRIKQYQGIPLEEIENEEDRQIVEIVRRLDKEYGLGVNLKSVLSIEEWCKEKYRDKKIWERNLPSGSSEDKYEKKLGEKLRNIKVKIGKYQEMTLEEIENEEHRKIVEIVRKLNKEYGLGSSLKNILKIEEWCKENYEDKKIGKRKLPSTIGKDEYEKSLGRRLSDIRSRIKQYQGIPLEEIENEEDRQIVEIVRKLDLEYNSRKLKARDIGVQGCNASQEQCDEAQKVLGNCIEKTKEGGITQSE